MPRSDYGRSFINIVLTDLRAAGIHQKSKLFVPIVAACLTQGKKVRVLVYLGRSASEEVEVDYQKAFSDFIDHPNFQLVFAKVRSQKRQLLAGVLFAFWFSNRLRNKFPIANRNLAFLISANYVRALSYFRLFEDLPADNWLGLTGNIELSSLMIRKRANNISTSICALQFGQASPDQYHFSTYWVDKMFVYDKMSKNTYENLGLKAERFVITGSPEFDNSLATIDDDKLMSCERLGVLFVDQPVGQRSEYSPRYLSEVFNALDRISKLSNVSFRVKKHPRGSAFSKSLSVCEGSDDIDYLLSNSHIVISFFSNLVDLALLTGRKTYCLRADKILGSEKIEWMRGLDCKLVDGTKELERLVDSVASKPFDVAAEVVERRRKIGAGETASSLILKELETHHVA